MELQINRFKTPILIICFNRPQYIEMQIEVLRIVKPPVVYISRDGARPDNPTDNEKTEEVKKLYLEGIDWDCKLITRFLGENLGCFNGPRSAMQWFFEQENEGIILEDDIIPGIDFFRFAQEMLEKYRNNKRIISISGCNFGYNGKENEYFFCKIMNMWGWATWRDRFNEIDFSMSGWNPRKSNFFFLYQKLKNHWFDFDINWWKLWEYIFNRTFLQQVITWDYQVMYHQIKYNKYAIYPGQNLITNLGFDDDATHTVQADHPLKEMKIGTLAFPLSSKDILKSNTSFYENYLKKLWANYQRPNWRYYIGNSFKNIIKKK